LCQAVEAAWNAGIVVVVAAGNDGRDNSFNNNGYGTINAPGNDPYVITVGAMNTMGTPDRSDDVMTTYSSKGPTAIDHIVKPDIVAPGNKVISLQAQGSTLVKEYPANIPAVGYYYDGNGKRPSPNYFTLSGTSMATPVVSAAAALLIQRHPKLTPDQVKALLENSATNINGAAYAQGNGELNISAALSQAVPDGTQSNAPSTGLGSVDGSRGTARLSQEGDTLQGQQDVFGNRLTGGELVQSLAGSATSLDSQWLSGSWRGRSWAGTAWSINYNWQGQLWSGEDWFDPHWFGHAWSAAGWISASWSSASWSSASWSSASWSSASWSSASWSGSGYSSASWSRDTWS